jgi:hypothetical protein
MTIQRAFSVPPARTVGGELQVAAPAPAPAPRLVRLLRDELIDVSRLIYELARTPSQARLDPAAEANGASAITRSARWLGDGRIAVAGADEESFVDPHGKEQTRIRATGLSIIDADDWRTRQIDHGASDLLAAAGLLLVTGGSWDSATEKQKAIGLAAYNFDGAKRLHRFDGRQAWVEQVYQGRAYVGIPLPEGSSQHELAIVDLVTGRTVGRHLSRMPSLLLDSASSWWEGG